MVGFCLRERDGRTDGQTEGRTSGRREVIAISPSLFFKKAWAGGDNHSMVIEYSAGLKTLLQYGNPGPVFNDDLVLASSKVKQTVFFPDQFKTIIKNFK